MDKMDKMVYIISALILAVSVLIDIFFVHAHGHDWWHTLIGFDVFYGFFGCMLIITASKKLGKIFIQRHEQYYGGDRDDD